MVPTEGLEPPHLAAHGPEPCASTNSATWALGLLYDDTTNISGYTSSRWCPRRDSNPHTLRHTDLNRARLPIPPRGHCYCFLPKLIQYQAFLFFARSTFAAQAQNFLLLPLLFLARTMLSLRKSRDYSGRFAKVKDPPAGLAAPHRSTLR